MLELLSLSADVGHVQTLLFHNLALTQAFSLCVIYTT